MYYFIVNPAAGRGKVASVFHRLEQKLREKNILGEIIKTTAKGDAQHLAHIAVKKGYGTVVAVGGDGTFHEILNGIAGTDTVAGIIPMGNDNYAAQCWNISLDWKEAVETIAARKLQKIDIIEAVEVHQYFCLSAGIGIEREMRKQTSLKKNFSLFGQRGSHYQALLKTGTMKMHIDVDQSYQIYSQVYNCSCVNLCFLHNLLDVPYASHISDGQMDCVLMSPVVRQRSIKTDFGITHIKAKRLVIHTQTRREVHLDGETITTTPVTFQIAPFQQKVIVNPKL